MALRLQQHNSVLEEVDRMEKAVLSGIEHVNDIDKLVELTSTDNSRVAGYAMAALARVFVGLDQRYSSKPPTLADENVNKLNEWIRVRFMTLVRKLLRILRTSSTTLAMLSVELLMTFVQYESSVESDEGNSYSFPQSLFEKVIHSLLDPAADKEDVINGFVANYLAFDDVRMYTYMAITSFISTKSNDGNSALKRKKKAKQHVPNLDDEGATRSKASSAASKNENTEEYQNFINNVYMLLHQIEMPQAEAALGNLYGGSSQRSSNNAASLPDENGGSDSDDHEGDSDEESQSEDEDDAGSAKAGLPQKRAKLAPHTKKQLGSGAAELHQKDAIEPLRLAAQTRNFTHCWQAFLALKLPSDVLENILETFDERIMPNYTNPKQLLDFLSDAFHGRGILAILSLSALFSLIVHHSLEYPRFFHQLYTLLQPSVFFVKYRTKFFRLVDIFLLSRRLPSSIAGAFAKRLARLALYAPPYACVMICNMIYNILKRHPTCKTLIHRNSSDDGEVLTVAGDPFDFAETDVDKCRALESSLWEVDVLLNHFHPEVVKAAKFLKTPALRKSERQIAASSIGSYRSMFESNVTWDIPETVATTFMPPTQGFLAHSGEMFSSLWTLSKDDAVEAAEAEKEVGAAKDTQLVKAKKIVKGLREKEERLRLEKEARELAEASSDSDDDSGDDEGSSDDDDDGNDDEEEGEEGEEGEEEEKEEEEDDDGLLEPDF